MITKQLKLALQRPISIPSLQLHILNHPGLVPHRMGLLRLLVLCTLAVSCTTTSVPLKVPSHLPFLLRGCNDADVLAMASSVLQDINNDLKEGYVLSLNRVSAVQEHRQASDNPLPGTGVCTSCIGQGQILADAFQLGDLLRSLCSPLLGCTTCFYC